MFKGGDKVHYISNGVINKEYIGTIKKEADSNQYYTVDFLKIETGVEYTYFYLESNLRLIEPGLTKEEVLINKINYLYEKETTNKERKCILKQSASNTVPAPSVTAGTISRSMQTGQNIASAARTRDLLNPPIYRPSFHSTSSQASF